MFNSYVSVYVESPVTWDNESEPLLRAEAERVISRIKNALDSDLKKSYELRSGNWLPA